MNKQTKNQLINIFKIMGIPFQKFLKSHFLLAVIGCIPFMEIWRRYVLLLVLSVCTYNANAHLGTTRLMKSVFNLILLLLIATNLSGQCGAGSSYRNIVVENFGTGDAFYGPPLPADVTPYHGYIGWTMPNDGQYTIAKGILPVHPSWVSTPADHTGNGGYMLICNSLGNPNMPFFNKFYYGLCPGAPCKFTVYAVNVRHHDTFYPLEISVSVYRAGTTELISSINQVLPGAQAHGIRWHELNVNFTTPANTNGIQVVLRFVTQGTYGNDVAIDDISLQTCAPNTPTASASGALDVCSGGSVYLTSSPAAAYQWYHNYNPIGGATGQGYTATSSGTYTVSTRPSSSCNFSGHSNPIAFTVHPAPVIHGANPVDATCYGANNGSISVHVGGGSGSYPYFSINNGASWQASNVFPGLAAGTYSVLVQDSRGCRTNVQTVSINQPAAVGFNASAVPVPCFGTNNGSITVSAWGGSSSGYQYTINNGASWQASNFFGGLSAGTYYVYVKDGRGCGVGKNVTVTQPTAVLTFIATPISATCFGTATGSIVVAASGGVGWNQYSKDDGATWVTTAISNHVFSGLAAGTYKIRVRDNNGCSPAMQTVTITQPTVLSFTKVVVPVTCFGANNGSVTVNATGGTGTKQYSKDDGATWVASNVFGGLAPAVYKIKVKDANGCTTAMQSITITQPTAVLAFTKTQVNITTCFGATTGSITVTATGGNGSYQYSKDDGATWQSSNIFSGLAAGAYKIKVKDSKACTTAMQTVTITQPTVLAFTKAVVPVTCFGANNGSVTVNATGGTGTKQYSKDDGATWVASNVFGGLAPAVYKIKVKDANGCTTAMQSITITQPTAVLAFTKTQVNITTCFGATTGSITVTATGGNGGNQYSKDDGATWQSGNIFSGLAAGAYKIKVKDSKACTTAMQTVTITQPTVLAFTTVVVPVTCFGANNGSVTVNATGGTGTKQYSKDDGATWVASNVFSGLAPGTYKIKVKDANGCTTAMQSITITQPTAVLAFTKTQVNITTCFGATTGTITITATGGNGSYQYSKDDGATWQSGNIFSGLGAGAYKIKVKDSKACTTAMQTVSITQPTVLAFTTVVVPVTCFGANNGSVTVNATGGTGTKQYSKDDGATWVASNVFGSLAPGTYKIKVKDANGCTTAMQNITITQPTAVLAFTKTQVNITTCFGATTGSITVTATGGNGSYQYSKDDGATWQSGNIFSGLGAGAYKIKVKDSKACSPAMQTVTITQPTVLAFTTAVVPVTCFGANNGSVTVNATGGTGSKQYSKDDGVTWVASNVFSGLAPAVYKIKVKDANGCTTAMQSTTINQPTAGLAFTQTQVNITTCFGATTGSITVTATGGNGSYQYSKDDGATWQSGNIFSGLGAGAYKIKVKDSKACSPAMQTVTITQPTVLAFTTAVVPVTCFGANNGSVTVNATGGTGSKQYSKDDGVTWVASNVFSGLAPAVYKIKVKDANGCTTAMQSTTINQPTAGLAFTQTQVNITTCFGATTGSITVTATGGNGSYQYSKDDGATWQSGNIFSGLGAGAYKIKVKDSKACTTAMQTVTITQPAILAFTTAVVPVTCFGTNNGSVTVNATGGTGTKQYSKDDGATWVASNVFSGLAPAVYKIKVKDANGCTTAMQSITITQPTAVLAFTTAQVNVLTCFGAATGTITITATGGNGSYQYSKDDGATWQSGNIFSGLAAGAYKIKMKDSKACTTAMQTVTITQPTVLAFTTAVVPVTCFGANNGSVTVNTTGGTGTKQYSKDDGVTWVAGNVFSGLAPAVYKIKVKDANGCTTAMQSITITQPTAVLVFTQTQVNITTCFGASTGSISITATGGNGSYQYSKDDGATWQSGNIFSSLGAGAYKIKVKDSKACTTAMQTVTITQPTVLALTTAVVPVTCFGANNGSVTVNATGGTGTGTKQYSKDDGVTWVASNVFSGLAPAVYKIKVKDANGCTTAMQSITITQPTAVLAFTTAQVNVLTCFGAATGTITITATGGNGSYQYSKDDGATWQSGNIFSGLAAGAYKIKMKDSKACTTAMQTVTITQPTVLAFTTAVVPVTCFGANNGSVTVNTTGGTGTKQYSKDDGVTWVAGNVFSGLAPAVYKIKVKDANGCTTAMQSITITQPTAVLVFTQTQVNITTCFGASTGSISITATGGNGSYQYSKDDGATWQSGNIFSSLGAGAYKIKVKDSKACTTAMQTVTITQPTVLALTTAVVPVTCFGANNGSITVNATGGTGTKQYSKDDGVTWVANNVFSGLAPAVYKIKVKDANGCTTAMQSITITQPTAVLAFTTAQVNVLTCFGAATGTITITATGGNGSYQYSKDDGATWQSGNIFSGLGAGAYKIKMKDSKACSPAMQTVIITQPTVLAFTTAVVPVTCFGGNNGSVTVNATGGTGTKQYSKDDGATWVASNVFSGLAPAVYKIKVKDANGCTTAMQSITITQPTVLEVSAIKQDIVCNGANSGIITVTTTGGTDIYQYSIDNKLTWQSSNIFNNLAPGTYTVHVKDGASCPAVTTPITITEQAVVLIPANVSSPLACPNKPSEVHIKNSVSGVTYTLYDAPTGGVQQGAAPGNGTTLIIYVGTQPVSTILYVESKSNGGACTSVSRIPVSIVVRDIVSQYPDIRIQICPVPNRTINLSSYLDTAYFHSVNWTTASVGSPALTSPTGSASFQTNQLNGTHAYYYTLSNACYTNVKAKVYVNSFANTPHKRPSDTIVVCRNTSNMNLNQVLGLDAKGKWIRSADYNPYLGEVVPPSIFSGAFLLDVQAAYAGLQATTHKKGYRTDPTAIHVNLKYSTVGVANSCWANKERDLVIIITSTQL